MKCLIVEDDFISRRILRELLGAYFDCEIAVDGEEAVTAFRLAHDAKSPYDLICMDIMMPKMDGREALRLIRQLEKELEVPPNLEVKVVMTTALDDPKTVFDSFYQDGATAYLVKPISKQKLLRELRALGLLQ
ncbi:two-component system, chemotaxis family, response regulator CheY [Trichlorobacter thiogenes]|uniref:Two-component system, chemotaxis family, response regulator CheY n=1 Tax=Trichlorobacter thiogenes TaxID=115783 RepID=A0A1T4PWR9_9BACT|nr:response regulator [Trichlorobacter thiogenes]SJZ95952.1 two-component system, chemotaxis family, response regulator CheY [Trichlorobacter thiogenes]